MTIVGLKLRKIRELRDFSQEYVATQLDMSQKAYSKIECGDTKLNKQKLNNILKVLDISESEFLDFDETHAIDNNEDCAVRAMYERLIKQYRERIDKLESDKLYLSNLVDKLSE